MDAVAQEGEPIRAAVTLAVCYGLRREEICGLRWRDIDFEAKKLYVRNTVTQNGVLKIEAERTKTEKSRRVIDLIDSTIPYLVSLKQTQQRQGIALNKVCVWPDGREVQPNYITHRTKRIMEKYGLERIRVHDLRHTAASLLATRATPKQVQEFLGHEDISTTMNVYTHLLDADRKMTSGIMDGILKNSVFCSEKCSEQKSLEK
ncbi:MAG: site-specific integrase [Oscillospiraceae bacterium]|nr:site-specific integrase [Oscillospiraceae bacterium]